MEPVCAPLTPAVALYCEPAASAPPFVSDGALESLAASLRASHAFVASHAWLLQHTASFVTARVSERAPPGFLEASAGQPPPAAAAFLLACSSLSLPREPAALYPPRPSLPAPLLAVLSLGASPKKLHEMERVSAAVARLASQSRATHVVDVGGGCGALSCWLAHAFALTVITVEAVPRLAEQAARRAARAAAAAAACSVAGGFVFVAPPQRFDASFLPRLAAACDAAAGDQRPVNGAALPPRVLLAGLHACGDLTPSLLRAFSTSPVVVAVLAVGCCHNLITEAAAAEAAAGDGESGDDASYDDDAVHPSCCGGGEAAAADTILESSQRAGGCKAAALCCPPLPQLIDACCDDHALGAHAAPPPPAAAAVPGFPMSASGEGLRLGRRARMAACSPPPPPLLPLAEQLSNAFSPRAAASEGVRRQAWRAVAEVALRRRVGCGRSPHPPPSLAPPTPPPNTRLLLRPPPRAPPARGAAGARAAADDGWDDEAEAVSFGRAASAALAAAGLPPPAPSARAADDADEECSASSAGEFREFCASLWRDASSGGAATARRLAPFCALRAALGAGPAEAVIAMDRLAFCLEALRSCKEGGSCERGGVARIEALFDPAVSPRNLAVIAMKGEPCARPAE